ncbi:uncharacterized protein HGUI_00465 [Hanseniaspora guilliermondii]|uniref:DH domain-containing protein n=1 Tax=Hanseniaspora guilliermondii TaxID=56406 RepID=A0A1L0CIX1_9ASCO|nr:uncharacterized protein HGUI_00465 [Hanseniaspora guilliermondii]
MFKNHDILDNFDIMGSDNMTPITERENIYDNPYATTLWKNKEENKMTINKFQTDSRENFKKTLSIKRNIQMKPLHLSKNIVKTPISSANKRKSTCSSLLDVDDLETSDLNSCSSHSDSFQNLNGLLDINALYKRKKISNTVDHYQVVSPLSLKYTTSPVVPKKSLLNSNSQKNKFDFINVIEVFSMYEANYLESLKLIKNCFYQKFVKNEQIRSKISTIQDKYDGEALIFGNINTMIELSISFLDELKDFVSSYFNINKNDPQFWSIAKEGLNIKDLQQFSIAQVMNKSFIKWKQTYRTYIITQQKQIDYIKFLLNNKDTRYYMLKWLELSVSNVPNSKKIALPKHEYLLKLLNQPHERLQNWQNFLESLVLMSKNVLSTKNYDMVLRLYENVNEYSQGLIEQTEKFNKTKRLSVIDCLPSKNHVNSITATNLATCVSDKMSQTSSFYSEKSTKSTDVKLKTKESLSSLNSKNKNNKNFMNEKTLQTLLKGYDKNPHFDLSNYETMFKTAKHDLHNLNEKLQHISFSSYTSYLKMFVKSWKTMYEAQNDIVDHNIYEMYLQKLEVQSNHLIKLENNELEALKKSLRSVINYVNVCYKRITDLERLLQIKSSSSENNGNIGLSTFKNKVHNVDKSVEQEAIERHIEYLSKQLKSDTPKLLTLLSKFKAEFIVQYSSILLEFLKIMVGNKVNLETYMEKYQNQEIEFGDNFDLIQQFINNKDKNEEIIKDNNREMYYNSRTFKYLFK